MTAKQPTKIKEALMVEHIETEVTIIQAKMSFEEAKRRLGLQAKSPTNSIAAR